ncbi:hypothetical protein [Clostridium chrysemydis]|uniref:hypothetical protein n=1 Tax=Clostridium chrysemydis TaxID=2665504 RepID=UPI0018842CEE|nr:hypothetical protein [Clostridium chrysemydis]
MCGILKEILIQSFTLYFIIAILIVNKEFLKYFKQLIKKRINFKISKITYRYIKFYLLSAIIVVSIDFLANMSQDNRWKIIAYESVPIIFINAFVFFITLKVGFFIKTKVQAVNSEVNNKDQHILDNVIEYSKYTKDDPELYINLKKEITKKLNTLKGKERKINYIKISKNKAKVKLEHRNKNYNLANYSAWICLIAVIVAIFSSFFIESSKNIIFTTLCISAFIVICFEFWKETKFKLTNEEEYLYSIIIEVLEDIEKAII